MMKSPLALLVIALLSLGVAACGGAGKGVGSASHSSSNATPAGDYLRGDDDAEGDESPNHKDIDDDPLRHYGDAAGAADERAVTGLVKRYYAAAAAGDGAVGCSLLLIRLAKDSNLGQAAEKAYPPALDVPPLHGKSCAQIMSLLFKEDHEQLAADSTTLQVTSVRVNGRHGLALLGFRTTPERQIRVERDGGAWKLDALLDRELP
jgi:predicted small secreted protein